MTYSVTKLITTVFVVQPLDFPGSGKKLPRKHELKVIIIVFWSLTSKLLLSSLFLLMQGTESQVISDLNYSLLVI